MVKHPHFEWDRNVPVANNHQERTSIPTFGPQRNVYHSRCRYSFLAELCYQDQSSFIALPLTWRSLCPSTSPCMLRKSLQKCKGMDRKKYCRFRARVDDWIAKVTQLFTKTKICGGHRQQLYTEQQSKNLLEAIKQFPGFIRCIL